MSFVPMDEVLATAQSTLKDADSMSKLIWRQWVGLLAMPELGISEEDVKEVVIEPVEFVCAKPNDMKALIELAVYDTNGGYLHHKLRTGGQRIYPDTRLGRSATTGAVSTDINNLIPVDVSEDNYNFYLGTNGENVGSLIVRYYVYPTDDSGLPLIRQEEVLPIVFFLHFMWAVRTNENQSEIQAKEIRWKIAADRIRAQKKMWAVNNDKMKQIVSSVWMRAIPSFDFNQY